MKKLTIIGLLVLGLHRDTRAQNLHNIYNDVQTLSKLITNAGGVGPIFKNSDTTWVGILKGYITDTAVLRTLTDNQKLKDYFSTNPFAIASYISVNAGNSADFTTIAPITSGNIANNLSAPALSAALVNVIIARAKQELTVAFFDHLKTELNAHPELDTLFPKTAAFIIHIESYLYAGSLNTLRQAFASDLANLPAQIPAFLKTPEVQAIIHAHPDYKLAYLMMPGANLVGGILKGASAGNVVRSLYPDPYVQQASPNVYAVLQLISTLSESVRDPSGKANWIAAADFDANILGGTQPAVTTNLFFGLLYEETKNISLVLKHGAAPVSLSTIIKPANVARITSAIKNIVTAFDDLQTAIQKLQASDNTAANNRFDQVIATINTVLPDCQDAVSQIETLVGASAAFQSDVSQVFQFIPQLAAVVQNVHDTQYSAAVLNSVLLIAEFLQNDQNVTVQRYIKYASFMAAIVEAKSSADITSAIDAAILPVGSSSIKSNTQFSISLNSYIGAGAYWEHYKADALPKKKLTLPTFGVSLPIGVAFNIGTKGSVVGAISIFASVIDLGAIASFKLSTPDSVSSQALPNFTWQNLLAPGAYVVFGRLFNSPLALGVGIQKGPQLRSISYTQTDGTTIDLSQKEAFRFGAFLTVDIPFFNLFSVPYAKPYH